MGLYWEAVRLNICRNCINGDGAGRCQLPASDECALEEYFPDIIRTVTTHDKARFDAYLLALREEICAQCPSQLPDGSCPKRKSSACALDRNLYSIVEVIHNVQRSVRQAV
ncbi:MAG TPA: hypothetical protein VII11_11645 [Bacteroidota bacterium]